MKANSTKLDETYRIHFEMSDGAPMGLEDVEADGFVLIAMNGEKSQCIMHNTNLEHIAYAIGSCADLRAAAIMAEGFLKARDIVKKNETRKNFAEMLMGIGKDDD